jgi:anthranilate synthase component 1
MVDPFGLYLKFVHAFGEGHAFLLEAARESVDEYRTSIVGALPVLEIQVKDGAATVFAMSGLADYLENRLADAGYREQSARANAPTTSVVAGRRLSYLPDDPMAWLDQIRLAIHQLRGDTASPPFANGLFGYMAFDAVRYLEVLPNSAADDRGLPDVRLQWHTVTVHIRDEQVAVYDELRHLASVLSRDDLAALAQRTHAAQTLVTCAANPESLYIPESVAGVPEVVEDISRERFIANVHSARKYILAGDIFQVVLSKRMRVQKTVHHYAAYEHLRKLNPSPYMFMAEFPDMRLFGASPEAQFRAVGGVAEMKPIAGTSKGRGDTPEQDDQLVRQLLSDEKERAEHVMLVDLCRNDLGRVCKYGSVRVMEFMQVEPYSHLFHIVSRVQGELRSDVTVFHALLATFPAGTLSGAPKIRAMEIIDELEPYRRGPYGGMIGMIDFAGNANTALLIRTVLEHQGQYYVQVGAGIVADSDPEQEWLECGYKAGAVLRALGVSIPTRSERASIR